MIKIKMLRPNLPLHKKLLLALLSTATFTVIATVAPSPKIYAVDCGVVGGLHADYAGIVVESVWAYPNGTIGGESRNTSVKITTEGAGTPGGNVVHLDSNHSTILNRQSEETFKQYDTGCEDRYNVVLGYYDGIVNNRTSTYVGSGDPHTTDGTVWALDCDWTRHPGTYQQFSVTGVGTPNKIPAGRTGSWDVRLVRPPNGGSVVVKLTYKLDPVEPSPTISTTALCTRYIVNNAGVEYNGWSTNVIVNISGTNSDVTNYRVGADENKAFGSYYPTRGSPSQGTITITRYSEYHWQDSSNNWHWSRVPVPNDADDIIDDSVSGCYSSNCQINSVTGVGADALPGGYIRAGGTARITGRVYNLTSTPLHAQLPDTPPFHSLVMQDNAGDYDVAHSLGYIAPSSAGNAQYRDFTIDITTLATPGRSTISLETAYENYFAFGVPCSAPINTYRAPVVATNGATCNPARVEGWAYAPETSSSSIAVNIYIDGDNGTDNTISDGTYLGKYLTDVLRTDVNSTFGITGNHGYSVALPASVQNGQNHTIYIYAEDPLGIQDTGPAVATMTACRAYTITPTPNVDGDEENPTTVRFTNSLNLTFIHSSGAPSCINATSIPWSTYKDNVVGPNTSLGNGTDGPRCVGDQAATEYDSYNIPAGSYVSGDKFCIDVSVVAGSGFVDNAGNIVGPPGPASPGSDCLTIVSKPFFKVDNASVSVGADYASQGCTGDGVLAGWFKRDVVATDYFYNRGASVDYSVMGKAKVSGVGSRQLTRFNSPTELTFANTVPGDIDSPGNSSEPELGGNFGDARCIDDVTPPPDLTVGEKRTGNTTFSSVYPDLGGNNTYVVAPILGVGQNKALYVEGDILIDENIVVNGPFTPGNGSSMVIKANKGNIYIAPNVTNIDAILVATPDGNTKGEIYTCANGFARIPNDQVYSTCATQLVIHGNVVARKINMQRTYGSLRDEMPANAGTNGSTTGGTNGITQKMVWINNSDSKPSGYKKCAHIQENDDEDDDVWGNNWLCLSKADEDRDIDLVYNHQGQPPGASCPLYPIGGAISLVSNLGLIDENEEDSWNNNWLCTNEFNTGVVVAVSPFDPTTTTRLCTVLHEPDDDHADNIWQNTGASQWRVWACMNKYVAGTFTPGTPPSAPNPLRCSTPTGTALSTRGTCAAEIYEFSPELYMSQPRTGGSVDKTIKWDSITSLPPVL